MQVQFKTVRAGPDGVVSPGVTVDLPAAQAREAIEAGFAVAAVEAPTDAAGDVTDEETATAEPPEDAARPPPRRRRGGR